MAVRTDQTPLRSGCETEDSIVASLPAGTPVEVRFRLSDGSDCFKVAATIDGKDVLGYVPATALTGLERYEQERSSAASVDVLRALNPVIAETKKAVAQIRRSRARPRPTTARIQPARAGAGASAGRHAAGIRAIQMF